MSEKLPAEYLGDGVYAILDLCQSIVLRTGSHEARLCHQEIWLEPEVVVQLIQFTEKCRVITDRIHEKNVQLMVAEGAKSKRGVQRK